MVLNVKSTHRYNYMGGNAVNISQKYFHNEDLADPWT